MKPQRLARVITIAFGLLLLTMLSLFQIHSTSRAQGGSEITLTKVLNKADPVVRVGEVLSFNITLVNNASFTLTQVTLVDEYNIGAGNPQNAPLVFSHAIPSMDDHNINTWTLTWTNVASPVIPPGGTLEFTVFFTAVHPQTTLVNRVEARDIIGDQGAVNNSAAEDNTGEAIGGAAPIYKATDPPDFEPQPGLPITFTQIITNDGAAVMTYLPLTDTYDASFLEFSYAIPTPTITSPGQLVWDDLTTIFGDLPPFASVVVTTVFTASTQVVEGVNQASTEGARDEYSNDLTAGQALVPITIIDDTDTSTPGEEQESDNNNDDDDDDSSVNTSTQPDQTAQTQDVDVTAQTNQDVFSGPNAPRVLPETGYRPGYAYEGLISVMVAFVAGIILSIKFWRK